jgi:hypothetical protein
VFPIEKQWLVAKGTICISRLSEDYRKDDMRNNVHSILCFDGTRQLNGMNLTADLKAIRDYA